MSKQLVAVAASIVLFATSAESAVGDDERLRWALDHTLAIQLENGLFKYDYDFLSGEPSGHDNIVRQAGTLFGLGEYLVEVGDPRIAPAMRAGFDALADRSLPLGKGKLQSILESARVFSVDSWRLGRALDWGGLLYDPTGDGLIVAEGDRYATADAGATALALIAELRYFRATGDARYADLRERWLRGLLALQVPGRGVRVHPATLEENAYSNGESWLALALTHEAFPDDERVASALRAIERHLLARYGGTPDRQFYHWGAITSAVRFRTDGEPRLADFAAEQAEFILAEMPHEKTREYSTCSLVEGLASSIPIVETRGGRQALVERMRERAALELAHNRALQIQPEQRRWEFAAGGVLTTPTFAGYAGAFIAGPHYLYTRTDITEHCISAFLKARRAGL